MSMNLPHRRPPGGHRTKRGLCVAAAATAILSATVATSTASSQVAGTGTDATRSASDMETLGVPEDWGTSKIVRPRAAGQNTRGGYTSVSWSCLGEPRHVSLRSWLYIDNATQNRFRMRRVWVKNTGTNTVELRNYNLAVRDGEQLYDYQHSITLGPGETRPWTHLDQVLPHWYSIPDRHPFMKSAITAQVAGDATYCSSEHRLDYVRVRP